MEDDMNHIAHSLPGILDCANAAMAEADASGEADCTREDIFEGDEVASADAFAVDGLPGTIEETHGYGNNKSLSGMENEMDGVMSTSWETLKDSLRAGHAYTRFGTIGNGQMGDSYSMS
jgi:hypothetical protein